MKWARSLKEWRKSRRPNSTKQRWVAFWLCQTSTELDSFVRWNFNPPSRLTFLKCLSIYRARLTLYRSIQHSDSGFVAFYSNCTCKLVNSPEHFLNHLFLHILYFLETFIIGSETIQMSEWIKIIEKKTYSFRYLYFASRIQACWIQSDPTYRITILEKIIRFGF